MVPMIFRKPPQWPKEHLEIQCQRAPTCCGLLSVELGHRDADRDDFSSVSVVSERIQIFEVFIYPPVNIQKTIENGH